MKKLLLFVFVLCCNFSFAQTADTASCKVEFYLLKHEISNADSSNRLRGRFNVSLTDLQDTAFIKDSEIGALTIYKFVDTIKDAQDRIIFGETHIFTVGDEVVKRVNALSMPLSSGRQFALVLNGQICYGGYFWNSVSSFGCDWITGFASGRLIAIWRKMPDYDYQPGDVDPRNNDKELFNSLKATHRFFITEKRGARRIHHEPSNR